MHSFKTCLQVYKWSKSTNDVTIISVELFCQFCRLFTIKNGFNFNLLRTTGCGFDYSGLILSLWDVNYLDNVTLSCKWDLTVWLDPPLKSCPDFLSRFKAFNQRLVGQHRALHVNPLPPADVTTSPLPFSLLLMPALIHVKGCQMVTLYCLCRKEITPSHMCTYTRKHTHIFKLHIALSLFAFSTILSTHSNQTSGQFHPDITFYVRVSVWGDLVLRRLITRYLMYSWMVICHVLSHLRRRPFHLLQL